MTTLFCIYLLELEKPSNSSNGGLKGNWYVPAKGLSEISEK